MVRLMKKQRYKYSIDTFDENDSSLKNKAQEELKNFYIYLDICTSLI